MYSDSEICVLNVLQCLNLCDLDTSRVSMMQAEYSLHVYLIELTPL